MLGDTNSALSLLVARKLEIPTFHLEAGNRSFDERIPEEINRRILDHAAHYNLAYSEHARRNLEREGLHPENICVTGSPLPEVIGNNEERIRASNVLDRLGLLPGNYFVVSAHRHETVSDETEFRSLANAVEELALSYNLPVIVSTHPRTADALKTYGLIGEIAENVRLYTPFQFFDYLRLQVDAKCVISDSGSVAEESAILDFPAITIRNKIERPEALEAGVVPSVGVSATAIDRAVRFASRSSSQKTSHPYTIQNFSHRVLNYMLSKL